MKAELIAGITALLVLALGKRPEDVVVLIEELDPDGWGQGGVTASELRRRRTSTPGTRSSSTSPFVGRVMGNARVMAIGSPPVHAVRLSVWPTVTGVEVDHAR